MGSSLGASEQQARPRSSSSKPFPPIQIQDSTQTSRKTYVVSINPSIILELALDTALSRPETGNNMAAKLLIEDRRGLSPVPMPPGGSGAAPQPMNRESQVRSIAVLLFLLTVAAVVFAGFNFNTEWKFLVPDDGVWWVENGGRLMADRVDPNGPGAKSGIKPGDQLVSINGQDVQNMSGLERQLYRNGVWSKASYSLLRQSVPLDSSVIL